MSMSAVVSELQSFHNLRRMQQQFYIFTVFSTKAKHGKMFVLSFQDFGSESGGTHFSEIGMLNFWRDH